MHRGSLIEDKLCLGLGMRIGGGAKVESALTNAPANSTPGRATTNTGQDHLRGMTGPQQLQGHKRLPVLSDI